MKSIPRSKRNTFSSQLVCFLMPMIIFLSITALEGGKYAEKYYPLLYTFKIVVVTALWWGCRHCYPKWSWSGWSSGCLAGIFGAMIWIGTSHWTLTFVLGDMLPKWLVADERIAFNPFDAIEASRGVYAFLAIRLFGLVVTVPLVEEVFWRGFLIRYLINEDFEQVPIGQLTLFSFTAVTLLFALVHPEFIAAIIWGAAINILLLKTRNLSACVIAHAVTNLLLGAYILSTSRWELW